MPRPLRIQYQNAIYHVMNRGQNRRKIFLSDDYYKFFLSLLKDSIKRWRIEVYAFCLMPNHYHLLIQTPNSNISRVMRHIDGVYTQWFNRRMKRDGSLFRGRYKSTIVDEDAYLVELLRYIHMNPVKAKLVTKPEEYKWSGHCRYLRNVKSLEWLTTHRLLLYFGQKETESRRHLRSFMKEKIPDTLEQRLNSKNWPSTYSSKMFQKLIEWNFVSDLKNKNLHYEPFVPIKISETVLKKTICEVFECSWQSISRPKGLHQKKLRAMALALYSQELGWMYKKLSTRFPGIHESTISKAIQRIQKTDSQIWKKINQSLQVLKK